MEKQDTSGIEILRGKKKGKHYVVGFVGATQDAVYSKETWTFADGTGGCHLMTFGQAKKHLSQLHPTKRSTIAIFELVPVVKLKGLPTSKRI